MFRTQIYLPEELHSELTSLGKKLNLPMAEVVRKILKNSLKKKETLMGKGNDLIKLGKLKIKGGPKDLSQNLDSYLYG